jgi:hypothetical protein
VRDDRPWNGPDPPAAVYFYSPDRRAQRPATHLDRFHGILQVDGYAGFETLAGGDIVLAACWAHARRKYYDIHQATGSRIAAEALRRIAGLYAIETVIRTRGADERQRVRSARARPLVDAFKPWSRTSCIGFLHVAASPGPFAMCSRWSALCRFLDDGHIELDNNPVERAIRPVALGRKNHLFAGSDGGADAVAFLVASAGTDTSTYCHHALKSRGRLIASHAELIISEGERDVSEPIVMPEPFRDATVFDVLFVQLAAFHNGGMPIFRCAEFFQRLPCVTVSFELPNDDDSTLRLWFLPDRRQGRKIASCPNDGTLLSPRIVIGRQAIRVLADLVAGVPEEEIAPARVLPQHVLLAIGGGLVRPEGVKHQMIDGLSIGFRATKKDFTRDGVRLLQEIKLFEISLTAMPMNRAAAVQSVKSVRTIREFEEFPRRSGFAKKFAELVSSVGYAEAVKRTSTDRGEPDGGVEELAEAIRRCRNIISKGPSDGVCRTEAALRRLGDELGRV